ncbi:MULTISPECIES: histidinol-phosphate transaminase [Legionella]|uniref:histidinol-phosphate transaminase n=1 Tax=Legionella TaxID=445 RepID=UPI000965B2BA|nr:MULTISPECIES: histidinol-phosphate transaminase [Legionella]MBN9228596.1 histidinol-phosphate transaminase [Legionella steelei]OJW11875.1 MAG: histidinol-phosphate transaminase [Legionella sp. 39-23]
MPVNFQQLPHSGIRSLVSYSSAKSIDELAREKGIKNIIKMASNENPLGCSPKALAALHQMTFKMLSTYPSPNNHPLKSKLAKKLKVNDNQLLLSNGSDHIFSLLLKTFTLHLGKHILLHDYAFCSYALLAIALNIPFHSVAINVDWEVNINNLIEACNTQTSIIFLANPNNPTGILIDREKIKKILENIPESTLLVIDEAYFEFAASQYNCNSIDWLVDHSNLVITRTFSKIYGLAGLRLGYALAHPSIIDMLHRIQLPFSVNQAALIAANAALDDEEFINLSLKTNEEGMQQIRESFESLNISYLPSAANFLTFDCKGNSAQLYNHLLDRGIIVRPLYYYKMDNYLRVTIGTKEQNMRFIKALNSYYHK